MEEKIVELLPGERIDDLIRNDLKIIQSKEGFCFSIDAVLLAHFATLKEGDKVIDLGTGGGAIPLLLTTRDVNIRITGVEIQAKVAAMATRSVLLNKLEGQIQIIQKDIKELPGLFSPGIFDLVITNPPYMPAGSGLPSEGDIVAISKHEIKCTLEDVIRTGSKLLNPKGRFAMVHRPDRLTDIICTLRNYHLEPKRLQVVHPSLGKKPSILLVEAIKDGQPGIRVLEPLFVHHSNGDYTEELLKIYYG